MKCLIPFSMIMVCWLISIECCTRTTQVPDPQRILVIQQPAPVIVPIGVPGVTGAATTAAATTSGTVTTTTTASTTTTVAVLCNPDCPTTATGVFAALTLQAISFATVGTVTSCSGTGVATGQVATLMCTEVTAMNDNANIRINGVTQDLTSNNGFLPIVCTATGWVTAQNVPITSIDCA